MDFRVLASILPVTPMLLIGAAVALKFTEQLMTGYSIWQNNLVIVCYVFGFVGVIGLIFASLEHTYADPVRAKRTFNLWVRFGSVERHPGADRRDR